VSGGALNFNHSLTHSRYVMLCYVILYYIMFVIFYIYHIYCIYYIYYIMLRYILRSVLYINYVILYHPIHVFCYWPSMF